MLVAGEGVYLVVSGENKAQINTLNKRLANLESQQAAKAKSAAQKAAAQSADPYAGWQTYENTTAGYTLRYPSDWTFAETLTSDAGAANYVTFSSAGKKYRVAFGLRPAGSDTIISGRTGLGQGETVVDGTIQVLGQTVGKAYHVNGGHTLVVFYGAGLAANFVVNDNDINAELDAPGLTAGKTDLRGTTEEDIADKIVSSLALQ